MNVQEVYTFIDAQTQWTEDEKYGVRQLYTVFVDMLGYPEGSHLRSLADVYRSQLIDIGITPD